MSASGALPQAQYTSLTTFQLQGLHVHVHVCIVPIIMTELCNPIQGGHTPLHLAASGGHTACVEHLLSTPGIDMNIKDGVSSFLNYTDVCLL